jgi:hypothetical protein
MKRYQIWEISDIQEVITMLNKNDDEAEYLFIPMTKIKRVKSIKIPYGKFNKLKIMPFYEKIKQNFNEKTLRFRSVVMGILYKNSIKEKESESSKIKPCVLVFSTKDATSIISNLFKRYNLYKFAFYFNLTGKYKSSMYITNLVDFDKNKEFLNKVKHIINELDIDWIDYDNFTNNVYSYKKSKPDRAFNKRSSKDWNDLLFYYLYSIGFPKKKVKRYTTKINTKINTKNDNYNKNSKYIENDKNEYKSTAKMPNMFYKKDVENKSYNIVKFGLNKKYESKEEYDSFQDKKEQQELNKPVYKQKNIGKNVDIDIPI